MVSLPFRAFFLGDSALLHPSSFPYPILFKREWFNLGIPGILWFIIKIFGLHHISGTELLKIFGISYLSEEMKVSFLLHWWRDFGLHPRIKTGCQEKANHVMLAGANHVISWLEISVTHLEGVEEGLEVESVTSGHWFNLLCVLIKSRKKPERTGFGELPVGEGMEVLGDWPVRRGHGSATPLPQTLPCISFPLAVPGVQPL